MYAVYCLKHPLTNDQIIEEIMSDNSCVVQCATLKSAKKQLSTYSKDQSIQWTVISKITKQSVMSFDLPLTIRDYFDDTILYLQWYEV